MEALKLVGLKEKYYQSSPFELSGGQKRRAAIAGVLAMRPKVLVLDEPTAGLDPKGRDEILGQIASLHKASGLTVILVSHSMEDIARYADRIIVMDHGKVRYNDTPKHVFTHYMELEKMGLAAPQVTYIMHDLREHGLSVTTDVTTVEEAADQIVQALEMKSGKKHTAQAGSQGQAGIYASVSDLSIPVPEYFRVSCGYLISGVHHTHVKGSAFLHR